MKSSSQWNHAWWTLRIGLGLVPILAGLDKFFNLLANWEMYLNPLIPRVLHISAPSVMHVVGVIEIVVGILMFTRFTRYLSYVLMIWLWAISLNLIAQGQFLDIAVRDILISLGAFTLAKLTEVRELGVINETSLPLHAASKATRRTA
jgi:uncharacterized membrane protein YphA (DoxX/SURF4 family)